MVHKVLDLLIKLESENDRNDETSCRGSENKSCT